MKLKLYTLFILLLCGMATFSQEQVSWAWAKSATGSNLDEGKSIATDMVGNVYITGCFLSPTLTFGNITLTNGGFYDIYIVKYDPNGNVIWAKGSESTGYDYGTGITTDEMGNVYLIGYYNSPTITFGNYTLTSSGGSDICIVKYDPNGNVLWAKSANGSTAEDCGTGITTDATGNVYLTGYFYSHTLTFDDITLTNNTIGVSDLFIAKYDSNGNVIWARRAGGNSEDAGMSITTDIAGSIYITGHFFSPTITFGDITLTKTNDSYRNVFIAKYNPNGNVIWAKNTGEAYGTSITTDAESNIYITGAFSGPTISFGNTTLTNNGVSNVFIAKYDSSGNVIWAKSAGGYNTDNGNGISTDATDNVYLIGDFTSETINFGNITLTNNGASNVFIAKYDSSGNVIWAKNVGSGYGTDNGNSISTDVAGNAYLIGSFTSLLTFNNTTLHNTGIFSDIFIAKLKGYTISNNSPICTGDTLLLLVSSVPGASYLWTGPKGFISTEQNPLISQTTPDMSGIYYVTITCDEISETDSTNVIIKPMPPIPEAGNNGPVCSGNVLSLTASTIPDATYLWTGPNGFTSTEQNPIVSNNATTIMSGTYNVTATVNGCTSPAGSTTVIVNETPATPMAGNNSPVCEGSELSLTASTVPDATYLWTGPNGFTSAEQNPIISNSSTATMSGTYSVTTSFSNGCTSDVSSTQVTVKPTPSAPQAGNNSPVCSGNTLSLTASTVTGASYQWTGPNGFTSVEQNPVVSNNSTIAMSGTYYVTATVNGCTSLSDSTNVIVNLLPDTPTAGNNGPVCLGSMLSLYASTIPNASYHWTGPYGFTSSEQNPVVSNNAQPWMSGLYHVIATDNNGCVSEAGLTNVSVVTIQPTPDICVISMDSITGNNIVVWNKPVTEAIDHFNVYTEGTQAGVFELIGTVPYNSFSIYTDTLSNPAQQAYRYKISVVDTCGNESGLSTFHKSIHLSIGQGMGTTYNLLWSHYEGFTYPTYNIYRGTNPSIMTLLTVISSTLDSYTDLTPPAGYVYYQIEAVNPNPCSIFKQTNYNSARSNIVSNNTNAVPEYPNESEISIYPNPANDNLTIIIPTYSAVNHTTLELFDIYGNLLKNVTVTGNTTTVDISGYPAGVYVVRFMDSTGVVAKRIIKR